MSATRWLLAFSVVGLTFLFYLHYVLAFGVNVPYWDDWTLLDEIRRIHTGQMDWWKLIISKHNEHLVGTAFLVESLQLFLTGFDYKLQLVTGVLIQLLTFGVLATALWRFVPENRRPLWLIVSSLIWFSLAQNKNLLWAFQTAWFLVSLFLAITLVCLGQAGKMEDSEDRSGSTWLAMAVAAAVLASFTLFQGIIVWFAGAVYLMGLQSYKLDPILTSRLLRKWLISTVLAGVVIAYIWLKMGIGDSESGEQFSLRTFIYIFVGTHGDFWGSLGIYRLLALGAVMLAFVCLALMQVLFSRDRGAYALPVSLVAFGVCFVSLIALGRARFGIGPASDSHYTAYVVLTYFGVLCILMRQDETVPRFYRGHWGRFAYTAVILLAAFTSSYDATLRGLNWRSERGMAAAVLLKYREEPDYILQQALYGDAAMVRRNAEFLEVEKLGAFGDSEAVPKSLSGYSTMPMSMEAMIARHPEQQEAIRRAWQVYQMGSDLRNAFNPLSDQFGHDLLFWCQSASEPGNAHYLSQYLRPFAADYAELKKLESRSPSSK